MEGDSVNIDKTLDNEETAAILHKAYLKPIARTLLQHMGFTDNIVVTVNFLLTSDDTTEDKFSFEDVIFRSEEAIYAKGDKSVQTETQSAEVASQTDPTTDNLSAVAVKVEKNSDLDYDELDPYDTDTANYDLNKVMKVMPSSPGQNSNGQALKVPAGIQCPLCPSQFNETLRAEQHLKRVHDIGNIYNCKYCASMLQSKTALNNHIAENHNDEINDGDKIRQKRKPTPKICGSKKQSKTVKTTAKKKKETKEEPKVEPKKRRGRPRKKPEAETKTPCKVEDAGDSEMSTEDMKKEITDLLHILDEDIQSEPKSPSEKPIQDPDYVPKAENKQEIKCSACTNTYKSRRALRRHFEVAHDKKRNICEICGKLLMGKESLYHHMRGVHGNKKFYKCDLPGCDKTFNFSHSLKMHKLKHSGSRPHMCSICGKTYLTAHHLKIHSMASHSELKNFTCGKCGKSFSYSTSLKMHERAHQKLRPNPCVKCGKAFVNAQALKYHVMAKHTVSGNFKCDECSRVYKTEFLLKTHKRRHTSLSERFMCDVCGNRFMYKSGLELHRAVHQDEKLFKCNICEKRFKTYPTLYSHQYVHRTDEPHNCQQCGKSFKTKERMKAHEKRHTGLKPFECKICFHCFPDNGGLSKHMKTVHCSVKRFSCDICGKTTSRADNLRVHMKVHYKGNINDLEQKELTIASGSSKRSSKTGKSNLPSKQYTPELKMDDNMQKQHKAPSSSADLTEGNLTPAEAHANEEQVNISQNNPYTIRNSSLYMSHLQQFNRAAINDPDDFDRSPENLSMNHSTSMPQHLNPMPHLTPISTAPMSTVAHSGTVGLHGPSSGQIPTTSMVAPQMNSGPIPSLHMSPYVQYVYPGATGANLGFYQ